MFFLTFPFFFYLFFRLFVSCFISLGITTTREGLRTWPNNNPLVKMRSLLIEIIQRKSCRKMKRLIYHRSKKLFKWHLIIYIFGNFFFNYLSQILRDSDHHRKEYHGCWTIRDAIRIFLRWSVLWNHFLDRYGLSNRYM